MEFKQLYPFTLLLILIGMVLGVGILVLDNFGDATKESTDVVNESVVFTNGVGAATANDEVTTVTYVGNSTIGCTVFNTALWCANYTGGGALAGATITLNVSTFSTNANGTFQVSYTYDADSDATTATADTVTAMSAISSTWLPLIVTIAVLAIILVLVIRSFNIGSR